MPMSHACYTAQHRIPARCIVTSKGWGAVPRTHTTGTAGSLSPQRSSASVPTFATAPAVDALLKDDATGIDENRIISHVVAPSPSSPAQNIKEKTAEDKAGVSKKTKCGASAPQRRRSPADFPDAYQSFSHVTTAKTFKKRYGGLKQDERLPDVRERVGGRISGVRHMGAILFVTIRSAEETLQVIRQACPSFSRSDLKKLKDQLKVGDIVGATGSPGRTKKGELSLYADTLTILAPYVCTDQSVCPNLNGFSPLADRETKYRYRFVDMLTSPAAIKGFRTRHAVLNALRQFLNERDFVEVETPMLHEVPSGANAKPFTTFHEANNTPLYLRVAPELYLKQCVVGGMERVYEIGRVFRNEDADRHHNPEFTSCELYAAYNTYKDLFPLTEDLIRCLAVAANGTTKVRVHSIVTSEEVEIDLALPFQRVSAYSAIEKATGVTLPPPAELNSPRGLAYLSAILLRYNIPLPTVRTASKMFDKLIQFFITDKIVEPTFVTDHPVCMSPLAKSHALHPGLTERFELFINGVEYCNAYSELNDPREQFQRFQQQLMDKNTGDDEAMSLDETFLKALQMGLPPTAGWGLGVDRLVALLTGSTTIRDTILFPLLKNDAVSQDAKRRRRTASFFSFNHRTAAFVLRSLEEEMRRRGMPPQGFDMVRQLHQIIMEMHVRGGKHVCEVESKRRWIEIMASRILEALCGRSTR